MSLGSYTDYSFGLEVPDVTDEQVEQVLTELREQQATLRPIDERGAQKDDIASVKFVGTIDGEPFDGGSADRLPLVIGEDRMIAGWEDQLIGLEIGATKGFDSTFPDDYRVEELRARRRTSRSSCSTCARRCSPSWTDEFATSVSDVETLEALRAEIRDALARSGPRPRPATPSATGSSTSRPPTPPWSSPR